MADDDTPGEEPACANCGRVPRDDNDWLWWRARSDALGELHLFCGDCDETEFGPGTAA